MRVNHVGTVLVALALVGSLSSLGPAEEDPRGGDVLQHPETPFPLWGFETLEAAQTEPVDPVGHWIQDRADGFLAPHQGGQECNVRGFQAEAGCEAWVQRYETDEFDDVIRVEAAPDGSFVAVSGKSGGTNQFYDPDGAALLTGVFDADTGEPWWVRTWEPEDWPFAQGWDIAISPGSDLVAVAGRAETREDDHLVKAVTMVYDASTGEKQWIDFHQPRDQDSGWNVAFAQDGDLLVANGWTLSEGESRDIWFAGYDAQTGEKTWYSEVGGPTDSHDTICPYCFAVSPDGSTGYAAWIHDNLGNSFGMAAAIDLSNGEILWTSQGHEWSASQLALSEDGSLVAVTGGGLFSSATSVLDAETGEELWSLYHRDLAHSPIAGQTFTYSVAFHPDGASLYIAGAHVSGPEWVDGSILAVDAHTGEERWETVWQEPPGRSDVHTVSLDPAGETLYISGASETPDRDYMTRAVCPEDGEPLWNARYSGYPGGEDRAWGSTSLAVAPSGERVYVVGLSERPVLEGERRFTEYDMALVSYEANPGIGPLQDSAC